MVTRSSARNIWKSARQMFRRPLHALAPGSPVYVFHHIPKCGGTSVNTVLDDWFSTVKDYRDGWTTNYPDRVALSRLRSCHCLCGHFELDGYYLHQRYPDVFLSGRYRVFTFVRDPLQLQLSLFRYERSHDQAKTNHLDEYLSLRTNYLAQRFPATPDNYQAVIDRYFFVGILEEGQASVDLLASMIGKRSRPLPWVNKSREEFGNDGGAGEVSPDVATAFKNRNALDYLIYDYCLEKFNRARAEQSSA